MAFQPSANQKYYLIPKHAQTEGMCLSIEDDTERRPLQLQKIDPNPNTSRGQKFSFEAHNSGTSTWYWIQMPEFDNRFLNVAKGSMDNMGLILSFQKEDVNHELFQLVYAGDGYYRIQCYNSRKFFDVWEMKTAAGSTVYQNAVTGTDNQLFKLVAVGEKGIGKSPTSFVEANEMARKLALAVIAKIPDYGAGLAFVVGTFWEENNKLAAIWEQMKAYVDARLEEYFKKAKLDDLADKLQGTMDELAGILDDDLLRGPRLVAAIDLMVNYRAAFYKEMAETLPYFVALQTIILGARHTLYHDFDTLFPNNPATDKEKAKKNLINDIDKYAKDIETRRSYLLEKRTDKVQFNAQLDELLYTSRFWKSLVPGADLYKPTLKQLAVPIDGHGSAKSTFDRGQGKITEIKLYHYNPYGDMRGPFSAIEVFYDGVSQGIKGGDPKPSKYPPARSIKLAADEWICSVSGHTNLTQLMFTTYKGQISIGEDIFGSVNRASTFCADLPDSMNAKLTGISGKVTAQGLSQLNFHWDYTA